MGSGKFFAPPPRGDVRLPAQALRKAKPQVPLRPRRDDGCDAAAAERIGRRTAHKALSRGARRKRRFRERAPCKKGGQSPWIVHLFYIRFCVYRGVKTSVPNHCFPSTMRPTEKRRKRACDKPRAAENAGDFSAEETKTQATPCDLTSILAKYAATKRPCFRAELSSTAPTGVEGGSPAGVSFTT